MLSFGVTWDYRCPFARNAHEHLVTGLRNGADWNVTWMPFSLSQVHVTEGDSDVWNEPAKDSGLLAMQAGVVVRDRFPERFLDVHEALFRARHDEARKIRDATVVCDVLAANGVDPDEVMAEIETGTPLETVREEHEASVAGFDVWGVPTFCSDGQAVFVRYLHRPDGDGDLARLTIERTMSLLLGWPELDEFKHTTRRR